MSKHLLKTYVYDNLTPETLALIGQVLNDLHTGPPDPFCSCGECEDCDTKVSYPGFVQACKMITSELEDIGDLYLDTWSDCVTNEHPVECEEPDGRDGEGWCEYTMNDWKHKVFGELAQYL